MEKKHLTFDQRLIIQFCLQNNMNSVHIAHKINKSISTVAREIKKHSQLHLNPIQNLIASKSLHHCTKLKKFPYVCNGCHEYKVCNYHKILYSAKKADNIYQTTLSCVRKHSYFDPELLLSLQKKIIDRIHKKQPITHIFNSMKDDIPFSKKTFYNLIDRGELNIKSFTLPRRVRFRKRKKKPNSDYPDISKFGHQYQDYIDFIALNPMMHTVQMDLVEGKKNTGYIMTLFFVEYSFLLAFYLPDKKADSIVKVLNNLYKNLKSKLFMDLFPIILTDNGTEFSNIKAIEYSIKGKKRSNLFFCRPYASYQKGAIENKHLLVREVFPKKTDFSNLTQEKLDIVVSHINSLELSKGVGYDNFVNHFGKNVLKKLNVTRIPENEVTLNIDLIFNTKY